MSREMVGRHYRTSEPIQITIVGTRIASITPAWELSHTEVESLPWIAPGLLDLQVNGYAGMNFTRSGSAATLDPSRLNLAEDKVTAAMQEVGVARYLPTVTTASFVELSASLAAIKENLSASIAGIHLEGPYICAEDGPRGAHPRRHVRPPDWEEFSKLQDVADGRIRLITLSPEYDSAPEFIRNCVASGVVVAIGHTNANNAQIYAAVDAGASLSTHLGNGAAGTLRRHPNYLWTQLDEPRLRATLIADGHHLPPEVFRVFLAAKTRSRCVLVSDVTCLGGMPAGPYVGSSLGDVEVLPGGKIVIAGQSQYLAGASARLLECVAWASWAGNQQSGKLAWADAWDMASISAAEVLGLRHGLRVDCPADLVVVEPGDDGEITFRIRETLVDGKTVYANPR